MGKNYKRKIYIVFAFCICLALYGCTSSAHSEIESSENNVNDFVIMTAEPSDSDAAETESALFETSEDDLDKSVDKVFPLCDYEDGAYIGRARIPSVGVDVAVYNSLSQSVCDARDSACFSYIYVKPSDGNYTIALADHWNQGFDAIKNCTVGCTLFIDCVDGNTYKYVCDWIEYDGHNDTVHLYNSNLDTCDDLGGICCYTCNESYKNITIVHFQTAKD